MDFMGLMKKAEKIQADMQSVKDELSNMHVKGDAGGGLVTVTLNGDNSCVDIDIDDSLMNRDEKDILEDLVRAAFNNAQTAVSDASREKMAEVTKGLPIPPGFNF